MNILRKKGLAAANLVHWFLLFYMLAALVWWFISLEHQNRQMTAYKLTELKAEDPAYLSKIEVLTAEEKRATTKYVLEGLTFLLVIIVAFVYVYRAVRRQFRVSQQQQNFIMAVTHEFKTPIAITKLNLETLLKHRLEEPRKEKLLQMTLLETNRLNTLTNNILISSQLEGGGYKMSKEELDLSALAKGAVQEFENRFTERRWNIHIEPDVDISGDTLLLQILINNLLDNATKYSPKEGAIGFTLEKKTGGVLLSVTDEGEGIPIEERKMIFDRFYRIGNETVRKAKGTGLGLYLCKKIAIDHNADIMVTNNTPQGSIFTIYFKL
ncbi:MAG: two-component sensor histidine kinase [Chitinophagaceae bacterium]|nr:two-component sensor histidine kinase [Chitinophagaceae bacterium]